MLGYKNTPEDSLREAVTTQVYTRSTLSNPWKHSSVQLRCWIFSQVISQHERRIKSDLQIQTFLFVCCLEESSNVSNVFFFSICLLKTSELETGEIFALTRFYSIWKNWVMLKLLSSPTPQLFPAFFFFNVCKDIETHFTINSNILNVQKCQTCLHRWKRNRGVFIW